MLVAVTMLHSDDEPRMEFYEIEALDSSRHVDQCILRAVSQRFPVCCVNAADWEEQPDKYPDESYLQPSRAAKRSAADVVPGGLAWAMIMMVQYDVDPDEDYFGGREDIDDSYS